MECRRAGFFLISYLTPLHRRNLTYAYDDEYGEGAMILLYSQKAVCAFIE